LATATSRQSTNEENIHGNETQEEQETRKEDARQIRLAHLQPKPALRGFCRFWACRVVA
jgi:hypothetical protein